jgi:hypothetical protein
MRSRIVRVRTLAAVSFQALRRRAAFALVAMAACAPGFATYVPRSAEPVCTGGTTGSGGVLAQLDQRGCDGYCPVYTVVLCNDGAVVYDGIAYVKDHGRKTRRVTADELAKITTMLDAAPSGPSPLEDAVGTNPPHLHVVRDGKERWLARKTESGDSMPTLFLRGVEVESWIGSESERERLWKEANEH